MALSAVPPLLAAICTAEELILIPEELETEFVLIRPVRLMPNVMTIMSAPRKVAPATRLAAVITVDVMQKSWAVVLTPINFLPKSARQTDPATP